MKKIGITLSGGGMMGVAQLGMLQALKEFNITPDIVTGTSMGAIIAGLYACGVDLKDIIKLFYSLDKRIIDIDYVNILKSIFVQHSLPKGLIKGSKIEKMLNDVTDNINIKDVKNPFAIVSTSLKDEKNIIFTNYDLEMHENRIYINDLTLSKAIRASLSLPILFQPIILDDGTMLVDGGFVNNTPLNLCQELGAEHVFVSDIQIKEVNVNNGIDILLQSIYVAVKEANLDDYEETKVPITLLQFPNLKYIPLIDISKEIVDYAIKTGYEDTYNFLSKCNLDFLK